MPEIFSTVAKVIELGFAATAVVVVVASFVWNQWKMVPALLALVASSESLLKQVERMESAITNQSQLVAVHDNRAENMYDTCKKHTDILQGISVEMARIEGK